MVYKKIADIGDSTADDAKRSKPHPDIFQATLKKLGHPCSKVLALGDTPYDAETAGKAEIWTVGVITADGVSRNSSRPAASKCTRMSPTF